MRISIIFLFLFLFTSPLSYSNGEINCVDLFRNTLFSKYTTSKLLKLVPGKEVPWMYFKGYDSFTQIEDVTLTIKRSDDLVAISNFISQGGGPPHLKELIQEKFKQLDNQLPLSKKMENRFKGMLGFKDGNDGEIDIPLREVLPNIAKTKTGTWP